MRAPLSDSPSRPASSPARRPDRRRRVDAPRWTCCAPHRCRPRGARRRKRQPAEMRDDDDLVRARQPRQPAPDLHRRTSTDSRVDLVEDHRGALGGRASTTSSASMTRESSHRSALRQREHVRSGMRGEAELDGVHTVVPGVHRLPDGKTSGAESSPRATRGATDMLNPASAMAKPPALRSRPWPEPWRPWSEPW